MRSRKILVTDGEQRSALALVRSLGRAGHAVFVCSASGRSLAGASRYSRGEARVAEALRGGEQFANDVMELIDRWKIDVLIPVSEAALLALLPVRGQLGGVVLPFPDEATFKRICDKAELLSAAPRMGIAIPEQIRVETAAEARSLDPAAIRYPVVLKPSRSVGEGDARSRRDGSGESADNATRTRTKLTVRHAANAEQMASALANAEKQTAAAREAVGVPDDQRIVATINLGEPAEIPSPKSRREGRQYTTWLP